MSSSLLSPLHAQVPLASVWPGQATAAFAARTTPRPLALAAILALHALLLWGLLQTRGVQQALHHAQPLVVMLLADRSAPAEPRAHTVLPRPPPAASPALPRLVAPPELAPPSLQSEAHAPTAAQPVAPSAPVAAPPEPTPEPAVVAMPPAQPVAAPQPAPPEPAQRPLQAAALQFSQAPVVVYPRLSRRNGESGRVLVRAFVDATGGAPRRVELAKSCGHPRLDDAALAAVEKARFKPTVDKGQAVSGWALIPIDFELEAAR